MTGVVPATRGEAPEGSQIRAVLSGVAIPRAQATSAVVTGVAAIQGRMTGAVLIGKAVTTGEAVRQAAGASGEARKGTGADTAAVAPRIAARTATGMAAAARRVLTARGQRVIGTALIDRATVVLALGGRAMAGTGPTTAPKGPGLDSAAAGLIRAVHAGRNSPADRGVRTGRAAMAGPLAITMTSG